MTVSRRALVAALIVVIASAVAWGDLDWNTLAAAGQALFHPGGLHIYANDPALKDGPAVVLVYAGLGRIGQDAAAVISHLAMWLLFIWALRAAGRRSRSSSPSVEAPVGVPRVAIVAVAALPVLVWNLPPFNGPEAALWAMAAITLAVLLALPRSGAWLRGRAELSRIELFGLLLIGTWALLAAGTAHLEDAVAITLIIWAAGAATPATSSVRPAIAIGVAMAFKPWAVAGVGVLLRRDRPLLVLRDLAIAGSIVAAAWGPFLLAGHGVHSASLNQLGISGASPLSTLGLRVGSTPSWARALQLSGILLTAVVARKSGRYESVAAAMCARLLLDPTTFTYYLGSLLFAVGATDLATGRGPRRVLIATAGLWLVPCFVTDLHVVAAVKGLTLLGVLGSYLWPGVRAATADQGTSASISGVSDASVLGMLSSSAR